MAFILTYPQIHLIVAAKEDAPIFALYNMLNVCNDIHKVKHNLCCELCSTVLRMAYLNALNNNEMHIVLFGWDQGLWNYVQLNCYWQSTKKIL